MLLAPFLTIFSEGVNYRRVKYCSHDFTEVAENLLPIGVIKHRDCWVQ